jgi:hypothetical protein
MIIALLALAFAMILGGFLSIFFGWDIVLVERGWTMVLAGSISAASGALLLGIAAAVSKLARIQAELARLHGTVQGRSLEAPAMPGASMEPSATALSGGVSHGAAAGAAEAAGNQDEPLLPFPDHDGTEGSLEGAATVEKAPDRSEPSEHADAVVPFRPRVYAGAPSPADEAFEGKVPEFLLGDRFRHADEEAQAFEQDASLPASQPAEQPENEPETIADAAEDVTPAAWPAADAAETVEPVEAGPADEPEPVPEEPRPTTIVGTYNSGDNRYVMFSDGSIEAQTPGGVFRFKSLDELKEFIASGGEGGSTAA